MAALNSMFSAPSVQEVKTLKQQLQALPQELQDEILDLTFTAEDPKQSVSITNDYIFSHILHISKQTRSLYAARHFHRSRKFEFDDTELFVEWFSVVDDIHRQRLDGLVYISKYERPVDGNDLVWRRLDLLMAIMGIKFAMHRQTGR